MKMNRLIFFLTLILLFAQQSLAIADERFEKVDSLFNDLNSTHTPGVALAIIQDDKIIYEKAFGMASLELGSAEYHKNRIQNRFCFKAIHGCMHRHACP